MSAELKREQNADDAKALAVAMCSACTYPHTYGIRHDAAAWGPCEAHEEAARWLLSSDWLAARVADRAPALCPECRAGKHVNCTGQAFVGDGLGACECRTCGADQ